MSKRETINEAALAAFQAKSEQGPVVMLNLLKFNPEDGQARYLEYGAKAGPLVEKVGGRLMYMGTPDELMLGDESWDLLVLVEYPTRGAFLAMISSPEYQAIGHLRDLSLERSVLYATNPMGS